MNTKIKIVRWLLALLMTPGLISCSPAAKAARSARSGKSVEKVQAEAPADTVKVEPADTIKVNPSDTTRIKPQDRDTINPSDPDDMPIRVLYGIRSMPYRKI